jgi:hypothetical protein
VERQPLKKLAADEQELLKLLERWRAEAEKAGHKIKRIAVAFETGRDGFWLARWLTARGIEAHVIHAASVAVSREHRRAKTDRLDTEGLKRAFLGWLRGEREHCKMATPLRAFEVSTTKGNRGVPRSLLSAPARAVGATALYAPGLGYLNVFYQSFKQTCMGRWLSDYGSLALASSVM